MKIYTDNPEGVTVIGNTFIDEYMPLANGEYVKVYLYLLRCADSGRELSLTSIADVFDHTESDIRRALTYWEKQDLIHLKTNSSGGILSVIFSDLSSVPGNSGASASADSRAGSASVSGEKTAARTSSSAETSRMTDRAENFSSGVMTGIPDGTDPSGSSDSVTALSREKIAELSEQKDIRQLIFIAEQYLQRTLNSSEQEDLLYYYDTLHFSVDLIEYLIEYCVSKGSFSRHYMRKVALSWADAGITTVLQAKQETNLYNKNYYTIMNAFGLKGRSPANAEIEIMSGWLNDSGYSLDLILEACSRTIRQTHQPKFEYANKILKSWEKEHVASLADVRELDRKRSEEQQQRSQRKAENAPARSSSGNRFNNFNQRDYDYTDLERKLLGRK